MRALMPHGQGSVCRMSGSGNTQRKAVTAVYIRGVTAAMPKLYQLQRRGVPCEVRMRSMRIGRVQAHLASWIWSATCGNGPRNFRMSTRVEEFFAEEAITSR